MKESKNHTIPVSGNSQSEKIDIQSGLPPGILEGLCSATIDEGGRIQLPKRWQAPFSENDIVQLIYAREHIILISQKEWEKYPKDNDLFYNTVKLDKTFRFLIPKDFLELNSVSPRSKVTLFGRQNHIQIYFTEDAFNRAKGRANDAAARLQIVLTANQVESITSSH